MGAMGDTGRQGTRDRERRRSGESSTPPQTGIVCHFLLSLRWFLAAGWSGAVGVRVRRFLPVAEMPIWNKGGSGLADWVGLSGWRAWDGLAGWGAWDELISDSAIAAASSEDSRIS